MSEPIENIRQQLHVLDAYVLRLLDHLARVEAERDKLIMALADSEGRHQGRPTAVG